MIELLLGGALTAVGGFVAATYQAKLARDAEARAETQRRADRLRDERIVSLRAAMTLQAAMAEHIRASVAGETPEQLARLRQQIESTTSIDADVTLLDAEALGELAALHMKLLERGPGTGVTRRDLDSIAPWMAKLQESYRVAKRRILSE